MAGCGEGTAWGGLEARGKETNPATGQDGPCHDRCPVPEDDGDDDDEGVAGCYWKG
jgi:hypothetical protein